MLPEGVVFVRAGKEHAAEKKQRDGKPGGKTMNLSHVIKADDTGHQHQQKQQSWDLF